MQVSIMFTNLLMRFMRLLCCKEVSPNKNGGHCFYQDKVNREPNVNSVGKSFRLF